MICDQKQQLFNIVNGVDITGWGGKASYQASYQQSFCLSNFLDINEFFEWCHVFHVAN